MKVGLASVLSLYKHCGMDGKREGEGQEGKGRKRSRKRRKGRREGRETNVPKQLHWFQQTGVLPQFHQIFHL